MNLSKINRINCISLPRERIQLNSVNQNTASLTGYLYRVSDTLGNFLGWWPFDNTPAKTDFAYTLLLHDKLFVGDIQLSPAHNSLELYPNPATNTQTLKLQNENGEHVEIGLYDLSGKLIKEIFSGKTLFENQVFITSLEDLTSGVYIYRILTKDNLSTLKTIKH